MLTNRPVLNHFGIFILLFTSLLLFSACSNNVEKVLEGPTLAKGVGVILSTDLMAAMDRQQRPDAQLSVTLTVNNGSPQPLEIKNNLAWLDRAAIQELNNGTDATTPSYLLQIFYSDQPQGSLSNVLVAEGRYKGTQQRIQFSVNGEFPLYITPYDQDGNGSIDIREKQALDNDSDDAANLVEILAGGNPNNPGPTFTSASQINAQERQKPPSGEPRYIVYTAHAISAKGKAVSYSITGGAQQNRFDIDASTGELAFINDWPSYDATNAEANIYEVIVTADDGRQTNHVVDVTLTDIFNMTVSVGQKSLIFNWAAYPQASYYKLLENPDGQSGYSQLTGSNDIHAETYTQEITLYQIKPLEARYQLEAYSIDNQLLATSAELNITNSLLDAIVYVKASNTSRSDNFGNAVAISADGHTLAVAANNEGSATSGIFTDRTLHSDCYQKDGNPNGSALNCSLDSGAVYLYRYNSQSKIWATPTYIKSPINTEGNFFGSSVALSNDGNTLAIGARGESSAAIGIGGDQKQDCGSVSALNCNNNSGAVYLYRYSFQKNAWLAPTYIKASNSDALIAFGSAVALSGDGNTLAVGAPYERSGATNINGNSQIDCANNTNCIQFSGAAYLYQFNSQTNQWQKPTYIKASNPGIYAHFGNTVALSTDGLVLAVGATGEANSTALTSGSQLSDCFYTDGRVNPSPTNCAFDSGAAYVYSFNVTTDTWRPSAYFKPTNSRPLDNFGSIISLNANGNILAVGAPMRQHDAIGTDGKLLSDCLNSGGEADPSNPNSVNCIESGAVYIYRYDTLLNSWQPPEYINDNLTINNYHLGTTISLSADGNTLAVGVPGHDSATIGMNAVSPSDCLNADGTTNLSPLNCAPNSGAAYLYQYDLLAEAWQAPTYIKASNASRNKQFGASLALSADSHSLAVGAPDEDSAATNINGNPLSDCIKPDGTLNPAPSNCTPGSGAVYLY